MQYTKGDTILKVENVNLSLGGNTILRDVNVEIKDVIRPGGPVQGQVVGFLGPSGIGKTKFFEILAGLIQPSSGTVQLGDPLVPVKVGRVGVVQQNYPLFNHRTVRSNLDIAARRITPNAAERKTKIDEILERFKLTQQSNAYPAQLSGGQKQRAAIAQQLLCSDRFLLFDEPYSGLDINMIQEVSDMICEIAAQHEQNTVIIVSHDIVSTAAISDTLWVMGRDRDEQNNIIPGARIKYEYDLCARDLAWDKDIREKPGFVALLSEIRGLFKAL
ncbi:MAG: ATP-binding cassette domain-containing protein [Saprospiraceae bacterium]|nr:ATP-binding cassette domain-containing protein [Saprospiraceae bacterium]